MGDVTYSDGWQPIETLPDEDFEFFVWVLRPMYTRDDFMRARRSDGNLQYLHSHGWFDLGGSSFTPTHWRPLPEPPE